MGDRFGLADGARRWQAEIASPRRWPGSRQGPVEMRSGRAGTYGRCPQEDTVNWQQLTDSL